MFLADRKLFIHSVELEWSYTIDFVSSVDDKMLKLLRFIKVYPQKWSTDLPGYRIGIPIDKAHRK